jgi:SpoVK/Ycf46/Vps4 family AAA+-type ATPase
VPTSIADHETLLRLWQRESALLPLGLYVDAAQVDRSSSQQISAIQRLTARSGGVLFLDTREPWPDLGRESMSIAVGKPTPPEQQAAWAQALGKDAAEQPARLAGQFNFNISTIRTIAESAVSAAKGNAEVLDDRLWEECLRRARPTLDQLAQPIESKAQWDDIELAAGEKNLLHQIAEQVRSRTAVYDGWGFRERMNRGLGISVLFAGESGTGKTMAAEVIANDLELLLYRIDLSAVVSKYIGETEKNLRKLFDAAEDGAAILFFDEADALFGKRSEVKDSHDRYANIEINYLLQRMEAYRGLAILATNMKASLDSAFLRRLRFIVNFPFPGPVERTAIWRKVFPPETPLAELDYARLAKLNLTGGGIHNIALNAAFLAARAGTRVTMPLVLEAARTEFRKLEKPVNEADFRWLESAGANG